MWEDLAYCLKAPQQPSAGCSSPKFRFFRSNLLSIIKFGCELICLWSSTFVGHYPWFITFNTLQVRSINYMIQSKYTTRFNKLHDSFEIYNSLRLLAVFMTFAALQGLIPAASDDSLIQKLIRNAIIGKLCFNSLVSLPQRKG